MTPRRDDAPLHVVLNPASGGGSGARLRPEIERELGRRGVAYSIEETTGPGDAVEIARAVNGREVRAVVAAGGDGTIHEVANGLLRAADEGGRPPPLGIIPTGTGNDFAKTIEGSTDRERIYDLLAAGRPHAYDVGRVEWDGGGEYFINSMGTGIDVEVVRQIERLPRLPGVVGYLVGLVRGLLGYRPVLARFRVDGEAMERTIMIAAIGNGPCVGGGFYLCPDARPDDGRFDICIVNRLGLTGIVRTVPRVMRGTHARSPAVEMHRARTAEIEIGDGSPLVFQLDGELREPVSARRLRVRLQPGRLQVLALDAEAEA